MTDQSSRGKRHDARYLVRQTTDMAAVVVRSDVAEDRSAVLLQFPHQVAPSGEEPFAVLEKGNLRWQDASPWREVRFEGMDLHVPLSESHHFALLVKVDDDGRAVSEHVSAFLERLLGERLGDVSLRQAAKDSRDAMSARGDYCVYGDSIHLPGDIQGRILLAGAECRAIGLNNGAIPSGLDKPFFDFGPVPDN